MRYMINTYGNVDLGTLDWNKEGLNFYTISISNNIKKPKDDNTIANIYCNLYRAVPLSATFVEGDMGVGTHGYLYIRDTRYTTPAEFKEAMRGQILRYELETPANGGYLPMYKGRYKVSNVCQLLDKSQYPATQTINGVTFTNNGDGSYTVNGTATSRAVLLIREEMPVIYGKGLIIGDPKERNAFINYAYYSAHSWIVDNASYAGEGTIFAERDDAVYAQLYIAIEAGSTANNLVFKPQLFDLTEMYGAGNEPATVAEFREKFPNELYPYSPYCWAKMKQLRYITTTKNLFDIPLTQGYPSDTEPYDNTTLRTFTFGTYIIGMTRNNYYIPSRIANVNISKNSISFKTSQAGFGISVPFLLTVGNTYTVSCKADNNFYPGIGITYYKEDGTLISITDSEIITNNPVKSFTVPENTYYTLILFYGRTDNEYTFSNIQLEEGSTATNYVPYGYLPLK